MTKKKPFKPEKFYYLPVDTNGNTWEVALSTERKYCKMWMTDFGIPGRIAKVRLVECRGKKK